MVGQVEARGDVKNSRVDVVMDWLLAFVVRGMGGRVLKFTVTILVHHLSTTCRPLDHKSHPPHLNEVRQECELSHVKH